MILYTVSEVAEILKTNKNFVYDQINEGKLLAIKGVGRIKVSEDALRDYIKEMEVDNDTTI